MRRILTSSPYEPRIGIPGAAGKISVRDSIRRTLLLPVADTHLDADAERAAGRLVKCDDSGSVLADAKSRGYGEIYGTPFTLWVDVGVTEYLMISGYDYLEFSRPQKAFINNVFICDAAGNYLQEILVDTLLRAKGVRWKCYLIVLGVVGGNINIMGYHFR